MSDDAAFGDYMCVFDGRLIIDRAHRFCADDATAAIEESPPVSHVPPLDFRRIKSVAFIGPTDEIVGNLNRGEAALAIARVTINSCAACARRYLEFSV
jgi:hypothetical protein